jgi:hypothetical protein
LTKLKQLNRKSVFGSSVSCSANYPSLSRFLKSSDD